MLALSGVTGVKPDSQVADNVREILRENTAPVWLLHSPAQMD